MSWSTPLQYQMSCDSVPLKSFQWLCAEGAGRAGSRMELLCHCHLPESLDRRNLLVIVASSPNWLTGMSPGCFSCLDLFISGIQFFPIIVCYSLRRVKCLWLEVSQLHHAELKQSDFCIPWGALYWLEILVRKKCSMKTAEFMAPKVAVLSHSSDYHAACCSSSGIWQ